MIGPPPILVSQGCCERIRLHTSLIKLGGEPEPLLESALGWSGMVLELVELINRIVWWKHRASLSYYGYVCPCLDGRDSRASHHIPVRPAIWKSGSSEGKEERYAERSKRGPVHLSEASKGAVCSRIDQRVLSIAPIQRWPPRRFRECALCMDANLPVWSSPDVPVELKWVRPSSSRTWQKQHSGRRMRGSLLPLPSASMHPRHSGGLCPCESSQNVGENKGIRTLDLDKYGA